VAEKPVQPFEVDADSGLGIIEHEAEIAKEDEVQSSSPESQTDAGTEPLQKDTEVPPIKRKTGRKPLIPDDISAPEEKPYSPGESTIPDDAEPKAADKGAKLRLSESKIEDIISSVVNNKVSSAPKDSTYKTFEDKKELKTGLFIIIGDNPIKGSIFNTVTNNNFQRRNFKGNGIGEIKISRVKLTENYLLNLISVSTDGKFDVVLDNYKKQLTGYTLIVDCLKIKDWEYTGYLARMLHERFPLPFFLVALNLKSSDVKTVDVFRDRLKLDTAVPVFPCDKIADSQIKKIFSQNIHELSGTPSTSIIKNPIEV